MTRRPVIVLLFATLLGACSGGEEESAAPPPRSRVAGDSVVVEAKVDRAQVDIGARVVYAVEVRYDPSVEIDFPPVLEQFENWLIHDAGFWRDAPGVGTKKVRRIEMTLDPGIGPVLTIPSTSIRWRAGPDDEWQSTSTDEITVEVVSVTEGAPEFREPLDAFELPPPPNPTESRNETRALLVTAAALVVLGVVGMILFRRKKERALPPLPPHEVAQRELAHLDSLALLEAGQLKEFYYRLTAILRRYIEARFGLMAPERTTEEFLVEMSSSQKLGADRKELLRDFLRAADMVKYARHEPPVGEARVAFRATERFVMTTIGGPAKPTAPVEERTHAV